MSGTATRNRNLRTELFAGNLRPSKTSHLDSQRQNSPHCKLHDR